MSSPVAPQELTATRDSIRSMLAAFDSLGIDTQAVQARCGPSVLEPAPDRAQLSQKAHALWTAAVDVSGESGLGVRLAEQAQAHLVDGVHPRGFRLLGGLVSSSSTLGDALLHGMRLLRLYTRSVQVSLYTDGERAGVALELLSPAAPHREVIDFILASGVLGARALTGTDFAPSEVCFAHGRPRDVSHHERVFRAPLRFDVAQTACYFSSRLLQLPTKRGNLALEAVLAAKAEKRLADASVGTDFARQVRQAIMLELGHGDASCHHVAARLEMHPKALARKLGVAGLRYRDLLEHVRYELAEQHVRRPEARIGGIARLLGYSDKSAFNRAFKRWAGCSAFEYRKGLGLPQAPNGSRRRV